MKRVRKNSHQKRKWLIIILAILVVAAALVAGDKWLLDRRNKPEAKTTQTTNQDGSAPEQQVTPDPNVPGGTGNQGEENGKLIAPSGSFVSHHRPSISGSGGPSELFSSCVVETPGASCGIRFTKGSIVKQLEKKKVDSDNTATWQWSINDLGLTAGEWTVEAVATYGDQELVTKDATPLGVRP